MATVKVTEYGVRGHGRGVPSLTCLHTRNTGGVKHPLPLSRTQRDLVCQQVYLTQRPTERIDKTVEQRQLNVSAQQSKAMHLCLYFTYTTCCFFCNKSNVCFCNMLCRASRREVEEKKRMQSAVRMQNTIKYSWHFLRKCLLSAFYGHWTKKICFVYTALEARKCNNRNTLIACTGTT